MIKLIAIDVITGKGIQYNEINSVSIRDSGSFYVGEVENLFNKYFLKYEGWGINFKTLNSGVSLKSR